VGERAYVSHHIGDLKNETTWRAFTEGVEHYCRLFDVAPQYVAHDLHPDYLSTRYAESLDVPAIAIQHHHAHVASCLADNVWPYDEPAIGLAFDGTGYGDDGTLWGGEWLLVDGSGHRRIAHMRPLALPGGEQAIRQPWRLAAYAMHELFGDEWPNWSLPVERYLDSHVWPLLQTAMVRNINCPSTSAIGRLFDTVAALVGVRGVANYEAQGPVEFEQIADHHADGEYPFPTCTGSDPIQLDWQPGVANIVDDIRNDVPVGVISMRYHRGLARGVAALTSRVAAAERLNTIALSGGVFQNALFTNMLLSMLRDEGLQVLTHRSMPPNDGGISLGQLVVANRQIAATK